MKRVWMMAALLALLCTLTVSVFAATDHADEGTPTAVAEVEEENEGGIRIRKAWTAAILMGIACVGGALGMSATISKAIKNIAAQPEASGSIRTSMMMGLVFIETIIIYALIVAILIIFVL